VKIAKGELEGPIEVKENGLRFLVDPMAGQKTGWFYDQRDNRAAVATLAPGARVLDLYSYTGGFALAAAKAGAREVMAIDRSEGALRFAEQSAALNGLAERCKFCRAEVFEELERLAKAGKRFDIVIADPPAFVKAKKDLNQGARAYRKLARLSAALVKPGGFLFIAHARTTCRWRNSIARSIAAWSISRARAASCAPPGGRRSSPPSGVAGERLSEIAVAAARLVTPTGEAG